MSLTFTAGPFGAEVFAFAFAFAFALGMTAFTGAFGAAFTGTLLMAGLAAGFSTLTAFGDALVPLPFGPLLAEDPFPPGDPFALGFALAAGFTTFAGFLEARLGDGLCDLAEALAGLDLGIRRGDELNSSVCFWKNWARLLIALPLGRKGKCRGFLWGPYSVLSRQIDP